MFGLIRFLFRLIGLILVILLVAAWFTNPTKAEFAEKAESVMRDRLAGSEGIEQFLQTDSELTRKLIEGMAQHDNYYVFGIFTVKVPLDDDYRFVGVLGQFIPLQEKNPLEWMGHSPTTQQ